MGGRIVFNKWYRDSGMATCNKMKLDSYLTTDTKIISKWTRGLNIRAETTRLLEENLSVNLYDPGLGKTFLDMTPKHNQKQTGLHQN